MLGTFEKYAVTLFMVVTMSSTYANAQAIVGASDAGEPLTIAAQGTSDAVVCVSPETKATSDESADGENEQARRWERRAATDLVEYIERMTGANVPVKDTAQEIESALDSDRPVLIVGELALERNPDLREALAGVGKQEPSFRRDAIVVKRVDNRVYLAGTNDDSHYYAVAWLLRQWGCRWYMPTAFGESIPRHETLQLGQVDHAYGPPFEIRRFWISWNGDRTGYEAFLRRNFMNEERKVGAHALGRYVEELVPEGGSKYDVPIAEPRTAKHVAAQLEERFANGEHIALGMDDGTYASGSELDERLQAGLYDKYFNAPMLTDPFMKFYNQVARILQDKYPQSNATIGFLAYNNITIPPQRVTEAEPPLLARLAPIDVDPIHHMDDPVSPPRQEFKHIMYRWADVMNGRVTIYDYDQSMLVWRDIPNPSHQAFERDVKHYRDAGILGIDTESRGAFATTFTNLYLRGHLMWNPDANVDELLDDFYPRFYGPAAEPMRAYWEAIFEAWDETIVTEHEYFVAPAIYTPQLMDRLKAAVDQANDAIAPIEDKPADARTTHESEYLRRMKALRLQWAVLNGYMSMVRAAGTDADYATAVKEGQAALDARLELSEMNGIFTTRVVGNAAMPQDPEKASPAWFPGEVGQYMSLAQVTDGTRGTLVKRLPLEWAFRRDPNDTGLPRGWAYRDADLTYWREHQDDYDRRSRKDYPTSEWEMLRTDLYAQAQGVRHPDGQSFTGYMWYKTNIELTQDEAAGPIHVRFPGLFNDSWLYVNGELVAHRDQKPLWWRNSYAFEWDVDLSGKLKAGGNDITVRCHNTHHMGGMFRRPFLYRPVEGEER